MSELIPLRLGFRIWRHVVLRSTGFPYGQLEALASVELTSEADQVVAARAAALNALSEATAAAVIDGQDENKNALRKQRRQLRQVAARIRAWQPPGAPSDPPIPAVGAFAGALDRFCRDHEASVPAHEAAVRKLCVDPGLREAIAWQAPSVLASVDRVLSPDQYGRKKPSELRWLADRIERYILRYHTRCESIGFFGPVIWVPIDERVAHVRAIPGPLIADTRAQFEHAAVKHLAGWLGQDPLLRQASCPRVSSRVWFDGATVMMPDGRREPLDPVERAILDHCDGTLSAAEIARRLVDGGGAQTIAAVHERLDDLARRDIAAWSVDVVTRPDGLALLGRWLDRAVAGESGDHARRVVGELEKIRGELETSHGQPERVVELLGDATAQIEAATGSPLPDAGSRPVAYIECRRGGSTTLGQGFVDAIAHPLSLLLHSIRWLTHELIAACQDTLLTVHESLRQADSGGRVSALAFYHGVDSARLEAIARPVSAEFARRWWRALGEPADGGPIERRAAELEPAIRSGFDAPSTGWPSARLVSPDVMVAANGRAAFERGDFQVVLSELHINYTAMARALTWAHDDPSQLGRAMTESFPDGFVEPSPWLWNDVAVEPRRMPTPELFERVRWLQLDDSIADLPPERTLPIGPLRVDRDGDRLVIRDPAGGVELDVIGLLWHRLMIAAGERLSFCVSDRPVRPRITVDRFVLSRASWAIDTDQAAEHRTETQLYLELAAWRQRHGVPRHVFVWSPLEKKPMMVDFASPIAVRRMSEIAARAQRAAVPRIWVTEMLPDPSQLWLEDDRGGRYCSEWRMTCVDQ